MFLAIDLEACNKYVKGSVFSIGVVGADDNFNVLFKRDIIINPHCKFCTNFRKPIEFKVSKEDVKNAPDMNELYEEIKQLFSSNAVILAHSANNDMFMLNNALLRAKVPPLRFNYICTQMIYSAVFDYMEGIALDKAVKETLPEFVHHKADDDAEMALLVLKECCEKLNCNYYELEKKLGIQRGVVDNYEYHQMKCEVLDKLREKHRLEKKNEQLKIKKECEKSNGIIVNIDYQSFDNIKKGTVKQICLVKDRFVSLLDKGDAIYIKKSCGTKEIIHAKISQIEETDSFVSAYYSSKCTMRNETLLDFLTRIYEVNNDSDEEKNGIVVLTLKKID